MSDNEQTKPLEDFIPNPSRVATEYNEIKEKTAEEFAPQIEEAKAKLAESRAANGWFAKRREFREARQPIDERHAAAKKVIEAQSSVISTELSNLLQKETKLEKGPLKKAKIRVAAQAQAIQDEIAELTELRNVLQEIVDLGIEVPAIDVNGDGVIDAADTAALDVDGDGTLDLNDIAAIDAKIAELEEKVADDPILTLLTKQIQAIHTGVEARQEKLAKASDSLAEDKEQWSQELTDTRSDIEAHRKAVVEKHRGEFNDVSAGKAEAIAKVEADKADAVAEEKADLSEYRSNNRSSFAERISNTWDGIVDGIQEAWKSTVAGNAKTTAGEEANQELLERRRATQTAQGGVVKKKQP